MVNSYPFIRLPTASILSGPRITLGQQVEDSYADEKTGSASATSASLSSALQSRVADRAFPPSSSSSSNLASQKSRRGSRGSENSSHSLSSTTSVTKSGAILRRSAEMFDLEFDDPRRNPPVQEYPNSEGEEDSEDDGEQAGRRATPEWEPVHDPRSRSNPRAAENGRPSFGDEDDDDAEGDDEDGSGGA